jgi:hypothetical protein
VTGILELGGGGLLLLAAAALAWWLWKFLAGS